MIDLAQFGAMRSLFIFLFTVITTGALAQCPKNPEISEELDQAYRTLKFAKFPEMHRLRPMCFGAFGPAHLTLLRNACSTGG